MKPGSVVLTPWCGAVFSGLLLAGSALDALGASAKAAGENGAIDTSSWVSISALDPNPRRPLSPDTLVQIAAVVHYRSGSDAGEIAVAAYGDRAEPLDSSRGAVERGSGHQEMTLTFRTPAEGSVQVRAWLVRDGVAGEYGPWAFATPLDNGIEDFVAGVLARVREDDAEGLQALVSERLVGIVDEEQWAELITQDLAGIASHDIPERFDVACYVADAGNLEADQGLPGPKWPVMPQVEVAVSYRSPEGSRRTLTVYARKDRGQWGLVVPVQSAER